MVSDLQRADLLLVERKLSNSRTHAQTLIRSGYVSVELNGERKTLKKASHLLPKEALLFVTTHDEHRYVSRGGLKLAEILRVSKLSVKGMQALDIGQSTGGFTDCLLQAGAAKVVGVEVGHGQLAKSLQAHKAVVCLEGINARCLPHAELLTHTSNGGFDLAVMDVSFISQTLIIPNLIPLIKPGGYFISLVKPQFEVGKEGVGKKGIVKDEALYKDIETKFRKLCADYCLAVLHYIDSPITGGDGNREFLLCAERL